MVGGGTGSMVPDDGAHTARLEVGMDIGHNPPHMQRGRENFAGLT